MHESPWDIFVVVVDPKVQREPRRKKNNDKNNGLGNNELGSAD